MNLREISPPTAEPISLEDARANLRADVELQSPPDPAVAAEDTLIRRLITAARKHAEQVTGRILTDAIYEWRRGGFAYGCALELPVADVGQIEAIVTVDKDGTETFVDSNVYYFDDSPSCPAVWLLTGQQWPEPPLLPDAVRVRFTSAYAHIQSPPLTVDETILQAMYLMIGHWFENREDVVDKQTFEVPLGALHLLKLNRVDLGV